MIRKTLVFLASLALAGCASFSQDGGFDDVERLTKERIGVSPTSLRTEEQIESSRAQVAEMLAEPLSADNAVRIALLNNRGLQASYAELGIVESDLVRAGRLANPSFGFGRLSGIGVVEIERAVMFDVLGLLTMPLARRVEQSRFEQAQLSAAYDTVGIATQARKAFLEAVAAQQLVGYYGRVREAAEASSELARRMVLAGNYSRLAQMREQSFSSDATVQLLRAKHQALAARERLVHALGLSRATRFVNVLHAGYVNKSESGEERADGYEIELELPIFDFGTARVARAEAIYRQAMNRTAAIAIDARSEVRESYSAYRTAYDLARHFRDEVVPLRKRISEENLLRYNGMLASVFDLLSDAKDQIAGVVGAVESLRGYWLAQTDLQTALTGRSPGGAGVIDSPGASTAAAPVDH